ncbi:hypothetical protein BDY21DRAFT_352398 [Lineolata rhizophorae]|uniref:Zn(2)-C6 fungal-type domain-containing protein n=1 Tax=Lineolata rhizophorae TaxID=578093 RepID=A0A6A6NT35_9PEZI|nr:hypothetical protein BDY21DRAFT_352398 [Lineolata rhizophorae]
MYSQAHQVPAQTPSPWTSQPPQAPPPHQNGAYAPPQQNGIYPPPPPPPQLPQASTLVPPSPAEPRHDMNGVHAQPYRLPAPHEMYRGPPPAHDPYRPPHIYTAQHQPAPRQRTAIACRYCRRRKIRCSGFDSSEDGRCTNCNRFSQECVFTPVSSQAQAFVPAHAVWRGDGRPPPLYGAFGQPLRPSQQDAYRPPQQHQGQPPPPQQHPQQPPPPPGMPPQQQPQQPYTLQSPTASSAASYHTAQQQPGHQPPQPQPYYAAPPQRRSSPQSVYSYDPGRTSSSSPLAHGTPGTPNAPPYHYPADPQLRPGSQINPDGRTPPPATSVPGSGGRGGVAIRDLVDSDMVNQLDRRPM